MHRAYSVVRGRARSDRGLLGTVRVAAGEVGSDVGVHQERRVVGRPRPQMPQRTAAGARRELSRAVSRRLPVVPAPDEAEQAEHGASLATVGTMSRRPLLLGLAVLAAAALLTAA